VEGLRHPAAQMSFAWIENNAELRRVIEGGDFGAWRVFPHPEQRKYAQRSLRGDVPLVRGSGHRQDRGAAAPGSDAGPS
jgi:hypothetical protein